MLPRNRDVTFFIAHEVPLLTQPDAAAPSTSAAPAELTPRARNGLLRELALALALRTRTPEDALAVAEALDRRFPASIFGIHLRPSFVSVLDGMRAVDLLVKRGAHEVVDEQFLAEIRAIDLMRCRWCGVHTDKVDSCWMCRSDAMVRETIERFNGLTCVVDGSAIENARVLANNTPPNTFVPDDEGMCVVNVAPGTFCLHGAFATYFLDPPNDSTAIMRVQRHDGVAFCTMLSFGTAREEESLIAEFLKLY